MKDNFLNTDIKKIYLNNLHINFKARFLPFANYSMPINYPPGIIKENLHTRKFVGIFDVSHMGQILILNNSKNILILEKYIPTNLKILKLNHCSYSFILNDAGGIIDDIIISKIIFDNKEYFFIVYNASRKIIDQKIFETNCDNYKILDKNCLIAIQGPLSTQLLKLYFNDIENLFFMQINLFNYHEHSIIISRTGYTGEDGFELSIPNLIVEKFMNELLNNKDAMLCGLGSRDTLRLEAGLSLYGNELDENITPIEADLSWAISKSRLQNKNFNGCKRIIEQMNNKNLFKRVGIKAKNKFILRSKMELYNDKNEKIGKITSGGFSPSLNCSIGIAYIDKNFYNSPSKIFCYIRNNLEQVELNNLPFIKHNYRRKI